MDEELRRLIAEKRELEQRIKLLTSGAKLDRIDFAGMYQRGKWALFFKYDLVANNHGVPQPRSKWQPVINGDSMDDVINQIPDVINVLTDLYEEVKHGTNT